MQYICEHTPSQIANIEFLSYFELNKNRSSKLEYFYPISITFGHFSHVWCCWVLTLYSVRLMKQYFRVGLLIYCMQYTAIFLINGLCIVYCSLLQCLTLVYLRWGQKSDFFCLLVTTRSLQSGTVVGYRSITMAYCRYMAAKGHWSTPGKGQSKVPCHCLPGGHIQGHWGVLTVVPGSKGLCVVPHLPCTRQSVSFRST